MDDHPCPSLPIRNRAIPDHELLASFVSSRDELAFEDLIRRHGPMVLGVCRRLIGDFHEAEDAFQAVFVVLARRAHRIRSECSLSAWLHGVALRVGRKARAHLQRSAPLRKKVEDLSDVAAKNKSPALLELADALDRELDRLPERERAAIVLCDLEGLSHGEAARELQVPTGTVSSHLTRGRRRLRERLKRLGVPVATFGTLSAVVPDALARSTLAASVCTKAGVATAGASALTRWSLLTAPVVRALSASVVIIALLGVLYFSDGQAGEENALEEGPSILLRFDASRNAEPPRPEIRAGPAPRIEAELEPR